MAEGEFALVRQHLEIALGKSAAWVGEHDLYAMLADAAAQQRDEAALRQYAPLAEEAAARYDHRLYRAIAHRAWGVAHQLAGAHPEAEARLGRALELFGGLDTRWQIGRTLFELGELARARSDSLAAREHFARALAAFEEMGAAPDAARTRALLETLT
jgi:tetratricopeptide (TPR) repeat protein